MSFIGPRRALLSGSALKPSWSWDFAARQALPPGASFSRASTATYFDTSGVLRAASSNIPRFDSDAVTNAPLGYLSEPQATNGFLQSAGFTSASWTKTRASAVANQAIGPDGAMSMAFLAEDASMATTHFIQQNVSFVAGVPSVISLYVKAGNRNWIGMGFQSAAFTTTLRAYFDVSNGVVGTTSAGVTAAIIPVGNGIFRITATATPTTTITTAFPIYICNANGGLNYDGDGVSGLYIYGAQAEVNQATSYIPTTTAAATRAVDALTMPITAIPGWTAPGGGFVMDFMLNGLVASGIQPVFYIFDGTNNNRFAYYARQISGSFAGMPEYYSSASGTVQWDMKAGPTLAGSTPYRVAVGWGSNRAIAATAGSIVGTPQAGSFSTPTGLMFFNLGCLSANSLMGTIRRIQWFAGARPDAFWQQVSR